MTFSDHRSSWKYFAGYSSRSSRIKKKRKRDLKLTFSYTEGHGNHTVSARNSIEAANVVREIVQHAQIVLHDNNVPWNDKQNEDLSSIQATDQLIFNRLKILCCGAKGVSLEMWSGFISYSWYNRIRDPWAPCLPWQVKQKSFKSWVTRCVIAQI